MDKSCFFAFSEIRRIWLRKSGEHGPDQLYYQTAHRTGKGVPLQQVPDPRPPRGDRGCAAAEWDSGQNLVSESEDEAEKTREGGSAAGESSNRRTRRDHPRENGRCSIWKIKLIFTNHSLPLILHSVLHWHWHLHQLRTNHYLLRSCYPLYQS